MKHLLHFTGLLFGLLILTPNLSNAQWVMTNGPYTGEGLSGIAVTPNRDGGTILWASAPHGIYTSIDNGENWIESIGLACTHSLTTNDSNLFVVQNSAQNGNRVWRKSISNDSADWIQVFDASNRGINCLAALGDNVFASAYREILDVPGFIFRSTDQGTSWTTVLRSGFYAQLFGNKQIIFAVVDRSSDTWSPPDELLVSLDNGNNWNALDSCPSYFVYCIAIKDNCVFAGGYDGMFLSTNNGETWKEVNNGLDNKSVHSIAFYGKHIFAGTNGGVYYSSDNAANWKAVNTGLLDSANYGVDSTFYCLAVSGSVLIASTYNNLWRRPLLEMIDTTSPFLTIGALSSPVINIVRFGIGSNEPLDSVSLKVNTDSVPLQQSGELYFGTYALSGTSSLQVEVFGSDCWDNCASCSRNYQIATLSKGMHFKNYALSGEGNGYLVVTGGDAGTIPDRWQLMSNVAEISATGAYDNIKIENTYSSTDLDESKIGIYQYENDRWEYAGGRGMNGKVSAAIRAGKIAVFYNPDQTSVPQEFALSQNYPNPFNPTTRLRYNLAEAGRVTLKVYNVLGQEVRTLVDAVKEPGYYDVIWDSRNEHGQIVSSGLYLYRMETGKFVRTKKMLLVK